MPRFSLSDFDDDDEKVNEIEPPHPLGFETPRTNWISDSETRSLLFSSSGKSTYVLDFSDDSSDEEEEEVFKNKRMQQSYPPLSSYISSKTVSTKTLLNYREPRPHYDDDESSSDEEDTTILFNQLSQEQRLKSNNWPTSMPAINYPDLADIDRKIQQKMQLERQRLDQEHSRRQKGVQGLVQEIERDAALILKDRQDKEDALRRQQEAKEAVARQDARDKEEELRKKNEAKAQKEKDEAERLAAEKKEQDRKAEAAKPAEYLQKAKKLVAQLVVLRKSVEPFDKNAAVKKRRFQMKKIVGGKVSTLSGDAVKIQEVAMQVSQAVTAAREEDAQIKERLQRKEPGVTADMAVGKRYMLDLLASNGMKRVQAEGFTGPKGDGFPLASMLAMVSLENKELVPILAAHIYTVCPIAIPVLPTPGAGASEEELMLSLGMQKGTDGEFESWDRFASRTESIISIVANIQSSSPSTHVLLGGHQGAADWLSRFLDLLPAPPTSPLPLLTAPVLHAFLAGAGNMLATKHPDSFQKHLETITNDIVNRLDEGAIGKPSAIRLTKLLEKGLGGFKSTLPVKAIPELYYGEAVVGGGSSSSQTILGVSSSSQAQGGFGSNDNTSNASPFGKPTSFQNTNSFGGGNNSNTNANANPFGGGNNNATGSSSSNSFGASNSNTFNNNPFGKSNGDQSKSNSMSNESSFGMSQTTSNPFGGSTAAPSPSPFGGPSTTPFGGSATNNNNNNNSGFGSSTTNAPFGSSTGGFGSNANTNASPFGAPAGNNTFGGNQGAPAPSPFGNVSTNPSPFGSSTANPSPFSGGSSSFGGGNQGQSFGGQNNNSSFGGNQGGNQKKQPCRFFAKGNCRFGNNCKFSHEGAGGGRGGSSFGGGGGSGFGGGKGRKGGSSFGGGGGGGGSSFGNRNTGFGGGSNPFGGGGGFNSNKRSPFG